MAYNGGANTLNANGGSASIGVSTHEQGIVALILRRSPDRIKL